MSTDQSAPDMIYPKPDKRLLQHLQKRAEKQNANEPAYNGAGFLETIFIFIIAILTALSLNTFVFQIIQVQGISMVPTFHDGNRVITEKVSYQFRDPKRQEVIICYYQFNGIEYEEERVIKRVIGLPGDTVMVLNGKIYVNDDPLDESAYWNDTIYEDMAPVTVPEGNVLVVGDNRNYSLDSRDKRVGTIPYSDIVGRVVYIIWPFNQIGTFPT